MFFNNFNLETKTFAQEPDLEDLIEYLGSNDVVLIVNSEAYLQHLFYKDDGIKSRFRYGVVLLACLNCICFFCSKESALINFRLLTLRSVNCVKKKTQIIFPYFFSIEASTEFQR